MTNICALPHIRLCNRSRLNFLIYGENFIFLSVFFPGVEQALSSYQLPICIFWGYRSSPGIQCGINFSSWLLRKSLLWPVLRIRIFLSLLDPDPDPLVRGSGSGSFYHQVKIIRKTLIPTVLWLLFEFFSLKSVVNVPSKSNKQKNFFLCQWRK